MKTYSRYLYRYLLFSESRKLPAEGPKSAATVVSFCIEMCKQESMSRPSTPVYSFKAAISKVTPGVDIRLPEEKLFKQVLQDIKRKYTLRPKEETPHFDIPTMIFTLFANHEGDQSEKWLRSWAMLLVGLCTMARPGDLANMWIEVNEELDQWQERINVTIWRNKTDKDLGGVTLPVFPCRDQRVDPVRAVREYLQASMNKRKTGAQRLFLHLNKEKELQDDTVGSLLTEVVQEVEAEATARSIRKSGRVGAIQAGLDPHTCDKIGRWAGTGVPQRHYEDLRIPADFTDTLFLDQVEVEEDSE